MSIPPEIREKLLSSTRERAAAFHEDMQHIRDVLARRDPSRGELRRLSAVLRRLLVDGDLTAVAKPRIGRFRFRIPDNEHVYQAAEHHPFLFFASGGAELFGIWVRGQMIRPGTPPPIENFDPDRTIEVDLEEFLSQRVLCLQGIWISRREVIKYIANWASGVHSNRPTDQTELTVARIRAAAKIYLQGDNLSLGFDIAPLREANPVFRYSPSAIDPVLAELLATARFLVASEDTAKLEAAIAEEMH